MNKKLIIYTIIGLIMFALVIAIIVSNKSNTNNNELEKNKNYSNTENIQKNISASQSTDIVSPITENTNVTTETNPTQKEENTGNPEQEQEAEKIEEENIDMIKITVNSKVLEVKLENNEATKSLVKLLRDGIIRVDAYEYGGFEKVGKLGWDLPREDEDITTSAGDIVLYQGNQISLFYNSNSWSYTKLGKVQNVSEDELKNILGPGDVTLMLSVD